MAKPKQRIGRIPLNMTMSTEQVIARISTLTRNIVAFWSRAEGWAPIEAAQMLTRSRLDWQVSLAHCLALWSDPPDEVTRDGHQILAYATLGALVECAMKLLLSVYYKDYAQDIAAIKKRGNLRDPDTLCLEQLRDFFKERIWGNEWDEWVLRIQQRRNAIHAFRDRDIGDHAQFLEDVAIFLDFLRYINRRLPYPDEVYVPREI